jgi:addiction module HigA family antidote
MDGEDTTYVPPPVPPRYIVIEYLDTSGWDQSELASRSGLSPETISEICSGKASITTAVALGFEKAFGRSAGFWLNLQARSLLQ